MLQLVLFVVMVEIQGGGSFGKSLVYRGMIYPLLYPWPNGLIIFQKHQPYPAITEQTFLVAFCY